MPKAITLAASRVLRAPFIERRGDKGLYLVDAPPQFEFVRVYQGFRRPDGLFLESGNPYRTMGEEGFKLLETEESPYLGSAVYRIEDNGRLRLRVDAYDSSD